MTKSCLLLIFLVTGAFCWYTKQFSTELYQIMRKDGSLKDLKNINYSIEVDWDELNEGMNKINTNISIVQHVLFLISKLKQSSIIY